MRGVRAAIGLGAVGAVALFGCSAIVRELDLHCDEDSDCDALNKAEDLETACVTYQCRADKKGCEKVPRDGDRDGFLDRATCGDAGAGEPLDCDDGSDELHPDAKEACDGVDNDCDELIDEGQLASSLAAPTPVSGVTLTPGLVHVGSSTSAKGRLELTFSYRNGDDGKLRWWTEDASAPVLLDTHCPLPNDLLQECRFEEVALASTSRGTLAVGINTAGCRQGQVRVGASFDTADAVSWQLASSAEALTGIDSDPLRSACSGLHGAAEASVALLGDATGTALQGLALWRDRKYEEKAAATLRGIALSLRQGAEPRMPRLQTTEAGASEALSLAPGYDPAAMLALPALAARGYILAYDAVDAVELAFLPAPGAMLEPLLSSLQRGGSIKTDAPRAVALAFDADASTPEALALAAAWRTGADGATSIGFSTISFAPTRDPSLRSEVPLTFDAGGAAVQGPFLTYAGEGFTTGDAGATGGWYVTWLEQRTDVARLMAVRVAQAGTQVLERPFVVHEEARAVQHLFAYSNQASQLGYGFTVGGPPLDLYIGSLGCPSAAEKAR